MSTATAMQRLRLKRKQDGKCQRCGWPSDYKANCNICKAYFKRKRLMKFKYVRDSKANEIVNKTLYDLMYLKKITTMQLSKALSVSQRTVERWIYAGAIPVQENKDKLEAYFGESCF